MWIASFGVAAALVIALIVFVDGNNPTDDAPPEGPSASVLAQQNRDAAVVVSQDQAPHTVALKSGTSPSGAIRQAVTGYMKSQIASGAIDGPLMRSSCTVTAGSSRSRPAFRCSVMAGNVQYPFLGVVDVAARQVVYCKRDAPPVPSMNIPVSPHCL